MATAVPAERFVPELSTRICLSAIDTFRHVIAGDLSDIEQTKHVADEANALGRFDAVIQNAGVYEASPRDIFTVNTLAPYVLTCLIHRPARLIYLSSDMHLQGRARLENLTQDTRRISYSDSKLYVVMPCMAVARRWPDVSSNAVDPGWVPTNMGGRGAADTLPSSPFCGPSSKA
jgi:NAD(P)-dependent dehydrogenase (short-subunit alcohol dehydrogenase family)